MADVHDGLACHPRRSAVLRLLVEGTRSSRAAFSADSFGGTTALWAGWVYGPVAMIGAGVTAFYMSRLFFMTFHGKARWTTEADLEGPVHPHESSPWMTVPMIILSVFSVG